MKMAPMIPISLALLFLAPAAAAAPPAKASAPAKAALAAAAPAKGETAKIQPLAPQVLDRIVAQVNEETILLSDLEKAEKGARETLLAQGKKADGFSRREVLQQLVEEALVQQTLAKRGLKPSDRDLQEAEDQVRRQNGLGSVAELRQAVEAQGTSYETFRQNLRRQIAEAKVIGYFIRPRVSISENDLRAEYRRSLESSGQKLMVRLEQLSLPLPAKPRERERALKEVRALLQKARQGTPLNRLAGAAGKKGKNAEQAPQLQEIPLVELGSLVPEIQVEVDHLQVGQLSEPVPAAGRLGFFKLLEKKSAGSRSFEEAKERLEQQLSEREIRRQRQLWLEELKQQALIKINLDDKSSAKS